MKTLTDRKLAEERKKTYENQQTAEDARKALEQAKATADTQVGVVTAERSVEIARFAAQAAVQAAEGQASAKKINAQADAEVTTVTGVAEAGRIQAIGTAEADVIKQKTAAMDQKNYANVEMARALAGSGMALVPQIVVGGNGNTDSGSLMEVLVAQMIASRTNGELKTPPKVS